MQWQLSRFRVPKLERCVISRGSEVVNRHFHYHSNETSPTFLVSLKHGLISVAYWRCCLLDWIGLHGRPTYVFRTGLIASGQSHSFDVVYVDGSHQVRTHSIKRKMCRMLFDGEGFGSLLRELSYIWQKQQRRKSAGFWHADMNRGRECRET